MSFNKKVLDLNETVRQDLTNTFLLTRHHKRNYKVDMVAKIVTLVITTKVTLFIIATMTAFGRDI